METTKKSTVDVQSVVQDRQRLLEVADELLLQQAAGEPLTLDEEGVFETLGWDAARLRSEYARAAQVIARREKAGTKAELESAKKRLDAARKRRDAEAPALRKEAKQIQAQLSALDDEVGSAAHALDERRTARQHLKGLCPEWIKARHSRALALMAQGMGRELQETKTRLAVVEDVLGWEEPTGVVPTAYLRQLGPEHPAYPREVPGTFEEAVDPEAFTAHQNVLREEKKVLEEKIKDLSLQAVVQREEIDRLLEHYLD